MDVGEQLGQDVRESCRQPDCRNLEAAGHEAGDPVNSDAAGEFAGLRAPHAVAHGEDKIRRAERGFADLAEMGHAMTVDGQRQEGVFVVGPHAPAVGQAGPADEARRQRFFWGRIGHRRTAG